MLKVKTYGKRSTRVIAPTQPSAQQEDLTSKLPQLLSKSNLSISFELANDFKLRNKKKRSTRKEHNSFRQASILEDRENLVSAQLLDKPETEDVLAETEELQKDGQGLVKVPAIVDTAGTHTKTATSVASTPRSCKKSLKDISVYASPISISTPFSKSATKESTPLKPAESTPISNRRQTLHEKIASSTPFFAALTPIVSRIQTFFSPVASPRLATVPASPETELSGIEHALEKFHFASEGYTTLADLLKLCGQTAEISFQEFFSQWKIKRGEKIGEATFSEVYRATFSKEDDLVIKVLPFGNRAVTVSGEVQSTVHEIYQEAFITKSMSSQKGNFLQMRGCAVIRGEYPDLFLKWWDQFVLENESENDRPDYFDESQLFLVLVMDDGGIPLENVQLLKLDDAVEILKQVVVSVAGAEVALGFEHRDLHWGNILISSQDDGSIMATIIDYTFSRIASGGTFYYRPYDDDSFFTGEGDYQFEIYRMMRDTVLDGDWSKFYGKTNVFWIHYLVDKFLNEVPVKKARSKKIETVLKDFFARVLSYQSCQEMIRKDPLFVVKR